jgi:hypothetical protein
MPTLRAKAYDGKVVLSWNDVADRLTREPLLAGKNDFEGYKLYRATDKYFSDAEKITDMYGEIIFKKPIFQCDLKDGRKGAADFAVFNGVAYYLGEDVGIQHYFVDEDVQNGRTYYYGLAAYDYGIEGEDPGSSIMPSENNLVIELDEHENIRFTGVNVQVVTPHQQAAGYVPPSIKIEERTSLGNCDIIPEVFDINYIKSNNIYKVKFDVDTLGYLRPIERFRSKYDIRYVNNGFSVYKVGERDTLIYNENPDRYCKDNLLQSGDYWHFNDKLASDPFDGIQLEIESVSEPELDYSNTGWVVGDKPIRIIPSSVESKYYPWEYEIVFTDSVYTTRVVSTQGIKDINNISLGNRALINQSFGFYIIIKSFPDSAGNYDLMDLVGCDVNADGEFNLLDDYVLAGHTFDWQGKCSWAGTVFALDFRQAIKSNKMPNEGDVYRVDFRRPFIEADSLVFSVIPAVDVDEEKLEDDMDRIKVVPNPYIATNAMESAVSNPYLNQPRRLMFTHIPANCKIKIFTSSGVLVDEIEVINPPDDGKVHWDMLTKEGLEIAAGVYLYYVKSEDTGKEKLGKFAVIK